MDKIVIKVGTSTFINNSRRCILGIVQQIVDLQSCGVEIILVSSGAIATGRTLLEGASKQACASLGQVKLMQVWAELFSLFGIQVGQVLLSKEDFSQKARIKDAIEELLKHGAIPIINENDTIATKIGDNDNLAALVAEAIAADTVILLTDQEGLFTADPRQDPEATLISHVTTINNAVFALAKGPSTLGTGGMTTKVEAAQAALDSGIQTIIASSTRPNVLIDLVAGKQIGTLFRKNHGN